MNKTNIFISPHLDDICYSAFIAAKNKFLSNSNLIITIFSKSCWTFLTKPSLEEELKITKIRQQEEKEFAIKIGAKLKLINLKDSSLRYKNQGVEYKTKSYDDPIYELTRKKVIDTLKLYQPISSIYIPMGISNHVDHLISRDVILNDKELKFRTIFLYEDLPYASHFEDNFIYQFATDISKKIIPIMKSIPSPYPKIEAMRLYKSQLENNTISTVINYGLNLGNHKNLAERYWQI